MKTVGVLIFDKQKQDTHSGGSGCGCIASVFSGYIYNQMLSKKYKKVLLMATGALTNALTSQQGESIPRNCTCNFNWNIVFLLNQFWLWYYQRKNKKIK